MLATGGSAIRAVGTLKQHYVKDITFICLLAAPEGLPGFLHSIYIFFVEGWV